MATESKTLIVHPGDIIQDSAGQLMLVTQTKPRFIGAVQRWHDGIEMQERYHRLRPGQFNVCGTAVIMPEEVAQARRDSLKTAALISREADK